MIWLQKAHLEALSAAAAVRVVTASRKPADWRDGSGKPQMAYKSTL